MDLNAAATQVLNYLISSSDERVIAFKRGDHMFVSGTYTGEPETRFLQLVKLPVPVVPGTIVSQEQYNNSTPLIRIEFNDLGSLEVLERAVAKIREKLTLATETPPATNLPEPS